MSGRSCGLVDEGQAQILVLRAFGDLVIAATASRRSARKTGLVIGHHLSPLMTALGDGFDVVALDHRDRDVPAIYDVRKRGPLPAIASLVTLRAGLSRSRIAKGDPLIVDQFGMREKLLLAGRRVTRLPSDAANIYLAYRDVLGASTQTVPATAPPIRTVGIFPGSRVAAKAIPGDIVASLISGCARAHLDPRLVLLAGERPDLEARFPNAHVVPRLFKAMLEAVTTVDRVISADSMPAHLAEYAGRPVHVLTPVANTYWLPESSFRNDRWRLFTDCDARGDWLGQSLG